jgi:type VI secretion system secreted protein Hcp
MKLQYRLSAALLAGAFSLGTASTALANEIFLKIPGVNGPATQQGFTGDIPLLAYSQGFSNSSTIGSLGTGAGAGKTQCGAISLSKLIDSTSTILLQHVVRGTRIPTATLYFLGATTGAEATVAPYTITLTGVTVTSISQGDSVSNSAGALGITENISLIAEKFEFSFRPRNANGTFGPPETTGWDCLTNSPF